MPNPAAQPTLVSATADTRPHLSTWPLEPVNILASRDDDECAAGKSSCRRCNQLLADDANPIAVTAQACRTPAPKFRRIPPTRP